MKVEWNFQKGQGGSLENPSSGGGVGIFWN